MAERAVFLLTGPVFRRSIVSGRAVDEILARIGEGPAPA